MYSRSNPPTITGTMVVRDTTMPAQQPGKKIVMVFGVLQVDDDLPINDDSMVVAIGHTEAQGMHLVLTGPGTNLTDVPNAPRGATVDRLLLSPIWRV